ncbi:unnamed protein product [Peniophora sp. CBMAI 1063]|nr:unnamed protein product [Peniophora sp. CBMAI 1063]
MLTVASILAALALSASSALAHGNYAQGQTVLNNNLGAQRPDVTPTASGEAWLEKYGPQHDLGYTGPLSFSHLEYARCLQEPDTTFDVAILGMPFDTTVTYRPGARFGPTGIRIGSRRQNGQRAYSLAWGMDPYQSGAKIIDCGDVPLNAYDNAIALDQMEVAYKSLLARPVVRKDGEGDGDGEGAGDVTRALARDGVAHPRIVSLGGDHTIVLPILRALNFVYGPVSIIHFDAHLDTWPPNSYVAQGSLTHGTFFYNAHQEGLIRNGSSIHAGIRTKMAGVGDIQNDEEVGFKIVSTEDIDDIGLDEVIKRLRAQVGENPVYLSLDIDVIDAGLAPATGTPEAGGWTVREVKRIIRGLAGLNFVGADVVEVSPAYDHADITSIAAADIVHDFLSMLMSEKPPKSRDEPIGNVRTRDVFPATDVVWTWARPECDSAKNVPCCNNTLVRSEEPHTIKLPASSYEAILRCDFDTASGTAYIPLLSVDHGLHGDAYNDSTPMLLNQSSSLLYSVGPDACPNTLSLKSRLLVYNGPAPSPFGILSIASLFLFST